MASLVGWLKFAGARLVTGLPVASGFARFYVPGSDVAVDIFADAAETEPLTQPVTLDAAGRAEVYCALPAEIAITTSTGASVGRSDEANTLTEDQIRATWGGSPATLAAALTAIEAALASETYTVLSSSAATPSYEIDPTVDTNVFRVAYAGTVTGITVALPSPAPTIPVGKKFTFVFQISSVTTLTIATVIDFTSDIRENDVSQLKNSTYSHVWSADFQKTTGGKICQVSPWTSSPGDLWTL